MMLLNRSARRRRPDFNLRSQHQALRAMLLHMAEELENREADNGEDGSVRCMRESLEDGRYVLDEVAMLVRGSVPGDSDCECHYDSDHLGGPHCDELPRLVSRLHNRLVLLCSC